MTITSQRISLRLSPQSPIQKRVSTGALDSSTALLRLVMCCYSLPSLPLNSVPTPKDSSLDSVSQSIDSHCAIQSSFPSSAFGRVPGGLHSRPDARAS
eukprot:1948333-Pleurochrysis_carterae.AAC.2